MPITALEQVELAARRVGMTCQTHMQNTRNNELKTVLASIGVAWIEFADELAAINVAASVPASIPAQTSTSRTPSNDQQ